jgi:hypothetical protein
MSVATVLLDLQLINLKLEFSGFLIVGEGEVCNVMAVGFEAGDRE